MRQFFSRLWHYFTVKRLAVAVFLAVAFVLWWGMPSLPESSVVYATEKGYYARGYLSPDGRLYLVHESVNSYAQPPTTTPWVDRLRVFDLKKGREIWTWQSVSLPIEEPTWTKQNHVYFYRRGTKEVKVRDRSDGGMNSVYDGEVMGFDPQRGEQVFRHHCADPCYASLTFSPDGMSLAIGQNVQMQSSRTELANLRTGAVRTLASAPGDAFTYPHLFSPDGSLLLSFASKSLSPGDRPEVLVHDVRTGTLRHRFPSANPVAFSPDSRLLASGDDQQGHRDLVRVWEVASGRLLATLEGFRTKRPLPNIKEEVHTGVGKLWFTPDSTRLCVGAGRALPNQVGGRFIFPTELWLFTTTTFQFLGVVPGSYPAFSSDSRYLSVLTEKYNFLLLDLQQGLQGHEVPGKVESSVDFGFVRSPGHPDLHFHRVTKPTQFPPWMQQVRTWLGLRKDNEQLIELIFRDAQSHHERERWNFVADPKKVAMHFTPEHDTLVVQYRLANDHSRLDLYSLPPRRPWLHIFGWAVAAGSIVELMGLVWHRRRKRNQAQNMFPAARTV